ncbi:MAG: LamG domain-containing protein [Bacteroidota bacterium]|nr:LamG domain-containing protein [Bacteroidota bacterium]
MKKNLLKNAGIACMSLLLLTAVFYGCSSSNNTPSTPGDQTKLTALIDSCNTISAAATTTAYPQAAITAFQTTLASVKTAAANKSITQTAVDNLVVQLRTAKTTFLATNYSAVSPSAIIFGLTFDEGTGTQLTTTGSNAWTAALTAGPSQLFGTKTALPTFVTGHKGMAMHFTAGSHLEIGDYIASKISGTKLSISVWVKTDSVRANNLILSYNDWYTWKFQTQDNGKPFFTVNTVAGGALDMDNQAVNSVPNLTWTHLVVSMDLTAGKVDFYVNGTNTMEWTTTTKPGLTGTVSPYTAVSVSKLPLLIGAGFTYAEAKAVWPASWGWETIPNWGYFTGSMDELKVYSIALNDGQVGLLYNNEK